MINLSPLSYVQTLSVYFFFLILDICVSTVSCPADRQMYRLSVLEFVFFVFKKAPECFWDCCLLQQATLPVLSASIRLRLRFSLRCNKSISSSMIWSSPRIVHGCVLIDTDTSLSASSGDAELKQSSWHVSKSGNQDIYWRCTCCLIASRKPGPQCLSWKGLWSGLEKRFPDLQPLVSSLWWLITASQEEPPFNRICVVTSSESQAHKDFIRVLTDRPEWNQAFWICLNDFKGRTKGLWFFMIYCFPLWLQFDTLLFNIFLLLWHHLVSRDAAPPIKSLLTLLTFL